MERRRDPDHTAPAPGALELFRGFLSLHDHVGDDPQSLPPSHRSIREFLVERGLLTPDQPVPEEDLEAAARVHRALHNRVGRADGSTEPGADTAAIEEAARAAVLELRFPAGEPPRIEATAPGVAGAVGRILAVAFLAELDGSFERLKACSEPTCTAVFYDRSKNRSGKWCSMRSCGNRNKVRAWRARQRSRDLIA